MLHEDVYEYFRNTALNANDPNLKAVGLKRPALQQNYGGGSREREYIDFSSAGLVGALGHLQF